MSIKSNSIKSEKNNWKVTAAIGKISLTIKLFIRNSMKKSKKKLNKRKIVIKKHNSVKIQSLNK